ncbi:hypothetical protein [Flavivirga eckloniae]|uniref:DUF4136 domain-containing protein n=1 Tax=Flavivirga eckloniae TaxID=1803846 RepID=A0A2K9PSH7_9FLAO|nr:hypothetical protein [Flavivirga eckloniae]AUP79999.1 hypothetical protein C1H87_15330 [Flavivirga eckloniae]
MKTIKYTLLLTVVALLSHCSSSYLQNSLNISKTKKHYKKILVVGNTSNKIARNTFESNVVKHFTEQGVIAKASIDDPLTKTLPGQITEEEAKAIKNLLIEAGYDGIVISNLVNKEQYLHVEEGNNFNYYNYPYHYRRFESYYGYYDPYYWGKQDEIKTGTRFSFESNFYNLTHHNEENLVWVGRFKITDPADLDRTSDKYAKDLVIVLLQESIQIN